MAFPKHDINSFLVSAINAWDLDGAKAIIRAGANMNSEDLMGNTILHYAAKSGFVAVLKVVIKAGANIDAKNEQGETPLCVAIRFGHIDVVEALIKSGANVDVRDKYQETPLLLAVRFGYERLINILLRAGADIHVANEQGQTTLSLAVWFGHVNVVETLVKAGVNVNLKDKRGQTVLSWAAHFGYRDIVQILLNAGADFNCKDQTGSTPLHEVAKRRYVEVMKKLIDAGAEINAKDSYGDSPLSVAIRFGHINSLMDSAVKKSYIDVIRILVLAGADINSMNMMGQTPISSAVRFSRIRIIKTIIRYSILIHLDIKEPDCIAVNTELSDYWNYCKRLIRTMQDTMLGDSAVSLYKFAMETNETKLAGYLSNGDANTIRNLRADCATHFSAYADVIVEQLDRARKREYLLQTSVMVMAHSDLRDFPAEIRLKISAYLDNLWLKNIVQSAVNALKEEKVVEMYGGQFLRIQNIPFI